jgi:hypothetical protein
MVSQVTNIMTENKELAKYLNACMQSDEVNTTFHLIKVPSIDELEFWIQQHRLSHCSGHYEWSKRFKKNMWVSDEI